MAFLLMIVNNNGGGGVTTVHPVLIGQFTSSSASAVTRTLTDSIANYQYLWFSMSPITSDSVWLQNTLAYSGYGFVDIGYFRNNALTLRYTTSPSGTLTARTMTLTYVSDTTFTSQASTSDSRTLYVYGIKDMPHGHWNETVLWTNPSPTANFAEQYATLSQSIENFDYIQITFRLTTSNTTQCTRIISVSDLKNTTWQDTNAFGFSVNGYNATTSVKRWIAYGSDTSIHINNCVGWSNTTQHNDSLIPTAVSGLKFS